MCWLALMTQIGNAQRLNVGITFQYSFLKQVSLDKEVVTGTNSYGLYYARDNRWKFFSAGQSIVIGSVFQLDYKRFYATAEPSFNLNTYNYALEYPLSPDRDEHLKFQVLFFQADLPFYLGYQFQSSKLMRYSIFAGVVAVVPYHIEFQFQSQLDDNPQEYHYNSGDLYNILYNDKPYVNALVGFGLHFASLGKVDIRYQHRLNSPGELYKAAFHTIGVGVTYYLPISLLKKKIYVED